MPASNTPAVFRVFTLISAPRGPDRRAVLIGAKRFLADMVRTAAGGDLGGALELAYQYLARVRAEYAQAEAALTFLERWSAGQAIETTGQPLRIGAVADLLGLTRDQLRNWERNGLIRVPRDPANGYRLYGTPEIARLRVLRMLREAGYSMMAILRLVIVLDAAPAGGQTADLRRALDTPGPDEDVYSAADAWLSNLQRYERQGQQIIQQIEAMIEGQQT